MIKTKKIILLSFVLLAANVYSTEIDELQVQLPRHRRIPFSAGEIIFNQDTFRSQGYSSDEHDYEPAYEPETDQSNISELEKAEKELAILNDKYENYLNYKALLEIEISLKKEKSNDPSFDIREIEEKEKELRMAKELYGRMLTKIEKKRDEAQKKYNQLSRPKLKSLIIPNVNDEEEVSLHRKRIKAPSLNRNNKKFSW